MASQSEADLVYKILANPDHYRKALDRLRSEESLLGFIKRGWHTLEPGQEFDSGWAVQATCDHLEAVTRGEVRNLLINVPPGCTKSMTTNVFWPAWEWGPKNLPHHRFISTSYAQELAVRDNMRSRDLMQSEWYQGFWGNRFQFKGDQNQKILYQNSSAGWRMAGSSGSRLTGFRGDRVILDDPHSVRDAESDVIREDTLRWFAETLPSRKNKQAESATVVIMQRVHERDVSGLIIAKELGYVHLMLPMEYEHERRCYTVVMPTHGWAKDLKPELVAKKKGTDETIVKEEAVLRAALPLTDQKRVNLADYHEFQPMYRQDPRTEDAELLWASRFPQNSIDELKKTMRSWGGTYAEAGQLQQRPAPRGGGMFKRKDFIILDVKPATIHKVRGWDFAATEKASAAHTAGVKMELMLNGGVLISNVRRGQWSPGKVETEFQQAAKDDGYDCLIDYPQDPGQAGKSQRVGFSKLLQGYIFFASPEIAKKEIRARPLAAQAEGGNLYIMRAEWTDDFINEACLFPNGQFKDQIDAASRAYSRLIMPWSGGATGLPETHDSSAGQHSS